LQRACDFLARREHSRKELANKLARRCADSNLIEDLLDKLSSEGLQSDQRFAENFVHHSLNKGHGPNKIKQELKQRGIESSLISQCMESESIDWISLAEEVRLKKYGENIPDDYQNKAKQSRFLYSRGFSSDVISTIMK